MGSGNVYLDDRLRLRCASCGKTNALGMGRLLDGPICGHCGADLPMPDQAIALSDKTFASFVSSSPLPVLIDFWAPGCGPCRAMGPIVDRLAARHAGKILVAKLDTMRNQQVAYKLGIQSVPTTMVFDAGRPIGSQLGLVPEQVLESMLPRAA